MITAFLSLALSLQGTQTISTTVESQLLDSHSPSCQVIEDRLAWMKKQAAEVHRLLAGGASISPSQRQDLEEFRKRWLSMNDELSNPWAVMTAQFALPNLTANQLDALTKGQYQITTHALGKTWTALKDELPPGWNLTIDPIKNSLTFSLPATATEYCSPTPDEWTLDIDFS